MDFTFKLIKNKPPKKEITLYKKIKTLKYSIFYSFIHYKNKIIGFGRKKYDEKMIVQVILNNNFDIIGESNEFLYGEDPRCFIFKNKLYILNNDFNKMTLIDYDNKTTIPLNISGKNISFISHKEELYFIHYIKPLQLYTIDIDSNQITNIPVNDDSNSYNYEYRGGTPGYKLNETCYYGYGHRTYTKNGLLNHDIFKWLLYFKENNLPNLEIINVEQPINSKNITDPTSVIKINNIEYLITAESKEPWFCKQEYITNVYVINDN